MTELLPVEMWKLIFTKHISYLNDLLSLKLVCKSFESIVYTVNITSLAVPFCYGYEMRPNWETARFFSTNQLIKNSTVFEMDDTDNIFQHPQMKYLLEHLKVLYIENGMRCWKDSRFSLYANLKNLGRLEQLQIETLNTERNTRMLKSPNLQILCIGDYQKKARLTLRCRNLREFKTRTSLSLFYFEYPKKITLLDVEDLKEYHSQLYQFKNLEHLVVRNGNHNPENILQLLPETLISLKMKEIDKPKMHYLLKQKKLLRRLNLKIYLSGILIETNQEIDDYFIEND